MTYNVDVKRQVPTVHIRYVARRLLDVRARTYITHIRITKYSTTRANDGCQQQECPKCMRCRARGVPPACSTWGYVASTIGAKAQSPRLSWLICQCQPGQCPTVKRAAFDRGEALGRRGAPVGGLGGHLGDSKEMYSLILVPDVANATAQLQQAGKWDSR